MSGKARVIGQQPMGSTGHVTKSSIRVSLDGQEKNQPRFPLEILKNSSEYILQQSIQGIISYLE